MPLRCRHVIGKQSSLYDQTQLQNNGQTHINNSSLAPEENFESWAPADSRKHQQDPQMLNRASAIKPSDVSYSTRNYGWDEIKQNEDETKRLRQLFSIWDAERIAILKLQHELDKNIFQRTFDYMKRLGQSIGLALWLWVHRPANCSNLSNLYQQQASFPLIDNDKSQYFVCTPYSDTLNNLRLQKSDDPEKQECSIPSIDTLPDSLWLKHFVLDETVEHLPPIARAMKNMLDHNALIWNSEYQEEDMWPHFINQNRVIKKKSSLRNIHENDGHRPSKSPSSSPKHKSHRKTPNIVFEGIDTKDQHLPKKMNTSLEQNIKRSKSKGKKSKTRHRSKSKSRKSSRRSKSNNKPKHITARTTT